MARLGGAVKPQFAGNEQPPALGESHEDQTHGRTSVFNNDECGGGRHPGWSALDQRQLFQGASRSKAAEAADLCGSLGPMVIHVPPDARPVGSCRPRQVCRTVCLA